MEPYIGTYQTFETPSKASAATLIGPDNLIGDRYAIECTLEEGQHKAWLVSRFNERIGFFDHAFSRQLSLYQAEGMTLTALLAFVAFTEQPEPGHYWGQVAVFAYNPREETAFNSFINGISKALANGVRPKIDLEASGIDRVTSSQGEWIPSDRQPLPTKEKGTAIIKSRRSITDRMIEQGRQHNKGCYFLSWAFLLLIVALIIIGLKSCGVF